MFSPIVIIGFAWITNTLVKLVIDCCKNINPPKFWWVNIFQSGGMPSGHTCLVMSLVTIVFWEKGMQSLELAMVSVFAAIVMHDALKQRRQLGVVSQIVNDKYNTNLNERMGHTFPEVIVGAMIGISVPTFLLFLSTLITNNPGV